MTSPSTFSGPPAVIALSGNPRPSSRTATVARAVADHVAALVPAGAADLVPVAEIELAELAGEVHLRPLLVELGATVPTRTFSITERQLDDLESLVDRWAVGATPLLRAFLSSPATNVDEPALSLAGAR